MAKKKRRTNKTAPSFSADYRTGSSAPVQDRDDTELDAFLPEGETLPEDFVCPICKHGAQDFEPIG